MKVISKYEAKSNDALEIARHNEFGGEQTELGKEICRKLLEENISLAEELAIIRKTLAKLINNENDFTEFVAYNEKVNEIKEEAKKEEMTNETR